MNNNIEYEIVEWLCAFFILPAIFYGFVYYGIFFMDWVFHIF